MAMHHYTAEFADGSMLARKYAKPLTHAWRVTYRLASNEAGKGLVTKSGMSGTETAARKNGVKGKKYNVESFEVVEVTRGEEIAAKTAPKKAKAIKPFAAGEAVSVKYNGSIVPATVEKVGRLYVYVKIAGFKGQIKIALGDATKAPVEPQPVALAA